MPRETPKWIYRGAGIEVKKENLTNFICLPETVGIGHLENDCVRWERRVFQLWIFISLILFLFVSHYNDVQWNRNCFDSLPRIIHRQPVKYKKNIASYLSFYSICTWRFMILVSPIFFLFYFLSVILLATSFNVYIHSEVGGVWGLWQRERVKSVWESAHLSTTKPTSSQLLSDWALRAHVQNVCVCGETR